jgi:dUTP pyrophosphatase
MSEQTKIDGDLQIVVELIDPRAKMPAYASIGDAGMDACACLFDDGKPVDEILLFPGETKLICLGFKVGLPDGWYLAAVPRSGISWHTPLRIANSPGTIDTHFKGVLHAVVHNSSPASPDADNDSDKYFYNIYNCDQKGNKPGIYRIRTGDRIVQLIPKKLFKAVLTTGKADLVGLNRGGGFGHTGV